ncbi:Dolichyl-diphosphooligosaccharide--protein glycosyltransferase subunit 2 [Echinococcus granulosus]|uniref:Dolichyl-diphosphooligosaccharide--protein glycosyltransferase subunit 2 n=1 Tax=Echinococcus granulosus TaxID=6210 RepID=U6JL08_ECHGR|nr:Dolichyl-diphosphooligosaccharide--protein glycosyltransferase subunit 2 [Echinococcus granulosus]EUB56357.1 Dolichyl-diphosphooligosaccharide--protein glycosyltransferase subunit 2 [Echinococcus granulosus]KAH9279935.1 Dolichyl-diphosphooligosaccharide--protein glycosyltransferase subunit 2 [Echinococcus granulosus]CDS22447.1 ormdl protein [Echinococcus granulosus]
MATVWYFIILLAALVIAAPNSNSSPALPIGALDAQDVAHFLGVFSDFNKDSIKDAHYAYIGNSVFNRNTLDGLSCDHLKSHFDSSDAEMQYYALSAARGVKSCTPKVSQPHQLKDALKQEKLTVDQLYYLVSSANIALVSIDKAVVLKLLTAFAARETGPSGLSAILATAAIVKGAKPKELEPFSLVVPKLVEQADEADGTILFFERGAYTTAFAVESIFSFAAALKEAPALTDQQVIKFGNFLYERRRAHQIRTAARVASAFKVLTTNPFVTPVVVYGATASERAGVSEILVTSSRRLHLRLFDLLGARLDATMRVEAGALYSNNETASNASIGPSNLGEIKRDSSIDAFELDLDAKVGAIPRGRYALEITATPTQKNASKALLAGVVKSRIPLRVVSPLKVEKAHIKLSDSTKSLVDSPLVFPGSRYSEVLQLHHGSRLRLTFLLEDVVAGTTTTPPPPPPQQVFIQLTHSTTHQSVTYIAKRSTVDGTYAFTLSLDAAVEDFDRVSGVYTMEVLIGDSLVESPIVWHVADVDLHFPSNEDYLVSSSQPASEDVARLTVASTSGRKRAVHPLIGDLPSTSKPLLEHTFRTPEPRPSDLVAFTFTALCCAPLLILIVAWPLMGANLYNFPLTLSAPLFHLGLGGIFGLYLLYWFKLDMFTTLRYLFFLGIFTFVTGNRLLRHLVTERRKSQN